MIKEETLLKAKILTSGVIFSSEALKYAKNTEPRDKIWYIMHRCVLKNTDLKNYY